MARFDISLPYILKHEGGWANDPDDPGGATNYGITFATAQRHGIMTVDALRSITPKQVAQIYEADYWRFCGIKDQRVATKVFDMAVNMGLKVAVRHLQSILNRDGAGLALDGVCGPKTIAAVNARNRKPQGPFGDPSGGDNLLDALCEMSANYYRSIVARRPASAKFLKGWLLRAQGVPRHA